MAGMTKYPDRIIRGWREDFATIRRRDAKFSICRFGELKEVSRGYMYGILVGKHRLKAGGPILSPEESRRRGTKKRKEQEQTPRICVRGERAASYLLELLDREGVLEPVLQDRKRKSRKVNKEALHCECLCQSFLIRRETDKATPLLVCADPDCGKAYQLVASVDHGAGNLLWRIVPVEDQS